MERKKKKIGVEEELGRGREGGVGTLSWAGTAGKGETGIRVGFLVPSTFLRDRGRDW